MTWRGTDWHRKQVEDMIYAGIDVILPVYWEWKDELWWSQPGLENLAQALEEVRLAGQKPPAVAMFYDTNSIANLDLRAQADRDKAYRGIEFFYQTLPRQYWAVTGEGHPVIWFYSSSPLQGVDQGYLDDLRQRFEQDFRVRPYIVVDWDWLMRQEPVTNFDATSTWLGGGAGFSEQVATVSPGVDDRWVTSYPSHSYVPRADGEVYRNAFAKSAICQTPWVVINSWNEYHEATDISETIQYGRTYLDLTRELSTAFKQGTLSVNDLLSDFKSAAQVQAVLEQEVVSSGLILSVEEGDGANQPVTRNDEQARTNIEGMPYLYFNVDDGFYFNTPQQIELTIRYFDEGHGTIYLDYDAAACASDWDVASMYKNVPIVSLSNSKSWRTASIIIHDATFTGHQNGYSDFRLASYEVPQIINQVTITKKP
ncbi:MAG: DUF5010 domain-containing protein [Anaerolineales bacterium]